MTQCMQLPDLEVVLVRPRPILEDLSLLLRVKQR